jgi:hypothetical protein
MADYRVRFEAPLIYRTDDGLDPAADVRRQGKDTPDHGPTSHVRNYEFRGPPSEGRAFPPIGGPPFVAGGRRGLSGLRPLLGTVAPGVFARSASNVEISSGRNTCSGWWRTSPAKMTCSLSLRSTMDAWLAVWPGVGWNEKSGMTSCPSMSIISASPASTTGSTLRVGPGSWSGCARCSLRDR